jgi:small GTP-binding protein
MESTRRRGGSFYEYAEDAFESSSSSSSSNNNSNNDDINSLISAQFEDLDIESSNTVNNNNNNNNKDSSNGDNEEEEVVYTRGRSRSRSIHQCDGDDNISVNNTRNVYSSSEILAKKSSLIEDTQHNNINNNNDDNNDDNEIINKHEKSGPLPVRELTSLKKGLEEASHSRNKDQLREEEEEKRAAESERKKRTSAVGLIQLPTAAGGTDPPLRRVKILLLGDSGVGKSSLILRWTMDKFSPTLVGTVGVNFKTKKVNVVDDEQVLVQVWDTAGQEQFHKITTSYYKGANGIMLVYDVSDRQSMENVEYWVKNIKSHATDSVQVVLVGNKSDLRTPESIDRCSDPDVGKKFSVKYGVPYFETSAKESINVDEAFMTVVNNTIVSESNSINPSRSRSPPSHSQARPSIVEKTEKVGIFDMLRKDKNKNTSLNHNTKFKDDEKEKCIIS